MQIEQLSIDALKFYENNPREISQAAIKAVSKSIKDFGFNQPIVVDKDNVIIVGHTRARAAKLLGIEQVPVLVARNLTPEQAMAYRIADNKTNELTAWDDTKLRLELLALQQADVNLDNLGFKPDEIQKLLNPDGRDSMYTGKVETPVYEIKGEKPPVQELVDETKSNELLRQIEAAKLPDEIARFLKLAAHRHNRFDYEAIAEFYAHADPDVQRLMENSALVIVDFKRAIELGFVQLADDVIQLYKQEHEFDEE